MPLGEITIRVKLSVSSCLRRICQLRTEGHIKRNVAVSDRNLLGVPITVFVPVKAGRLAEDWITRFKSLIATILEVRRTHRLAEYFDYIMKLALPQIDVYDTAYKNVVRSIESLEISGHLFDGNTSGRLCAATVLRRRGQYL